MGETGSVEQGRIGTALEVAGGLLRRGDLDAARRVLWTIKEPLGILLSYEPRVSQPETTEVGR